LEIDAEGIEVDLVAQPAAERLERLCGVVAAAKEAAVHGPLNATTDRPEQRRHRQRGRCDREP
jgi:hypothetical protein